MSQAKRNNPNGNNSRNVLSSHELVGVKTTLSINGDPHFYLRNTSHFTNKIMMSSTLVDTAKSGISSSFGVSGVAGTSTPMTTSHDPYHNLKP
jgi:hypothetical protein